MSELFSMTLELEKSKIEIPSTELFSFLMLSLSKVTWEFSLLNIGPFIEDNLKSDIVATESEVRMIRCWEVEVTFYTEKFLIVKIDWSSSTKASCLTVSWYYRSEMFAIEAENA